MKKKSQKIIKYFFCLHPWGIIGAYKQWFILYTRHNLWFMNEKKNSFFLFTIFFNLVVYFEFHDDKTDTDDKANYVLPTW